MTKVGFIGLGIMGKPMALNLMRGGHALYAHARRELPNTSTAQELFNACSARGGAAWDHSAMVRALENMANFELK